MVFTSKLQITLYSVMNLLGILHLLFFCPSEGTTSNGFTTDLIHRDSPLSPFYNPSRTHFDRLYDSFQRSLKRVNHFKLSALSEIDAPMTPGGGEYLMKMSLGTPPVEIIGIADTGSDLTWTQCQPCIECYKQIPPLFDSTHSSSYQTVSCQTDYCNAVNKPTCGGNNNTCGYSYSYNDGSFTAGELATETATLGINKSVSFQQIVFGCSNNNGGIFDESGSGIIGLGQGKVSLISQLGRSIGKKFSYCLAPTSSNSTSKISFGGDSVASSYGGIVTTPIVTISNKTHYYLSLEGFSIGNQTIPYNSDGVEFEGNIIIDSGTTFTLVPSKVFDDLVSALDKVVLSAEKVKDPKGLFSLCYKDHDGHNIQLPTITAHIKGGDLILQPLNTFSWVTDDVVCLAMISSDFPIYGNLAQTNFKVGFDLEAGTLSFQPTDCTQQ